jgi:hypothetical protein
MIEGGPIMTKQTFSQETDAFQETIAQLTGEQFVEDIALRYPVPRPILPNSGLYTYSLLTPIGPQPIHPPLTPIPNPGIAEASEIPVSSAVSPVLPFIPYGELRLDVDGYYPQMKASGQISGRKISPGYWIADVIKTTANTYEGAVWYKEGNLALLAFTQVKIEVSRTLLSPQTAKVIFSGGGTPEIVRTLVLPPSTAAPDSTWRSQGRGM